MYQSIPAVNILPADQGEFLRGQNPHPQAEKGWKTKAHGEKSYAKKP